MSSKRIIQVCLLAAVLLASLAAAPDARASSWCGSSYVVQRGDTLSSIAARHGTTVADLVQLNDLRDRNTIRIGQRLKVAS